MNSSRHHASWGALQRKAARQTGPWDTTSARKQDPSRGWRITQAEIARTHARVANLRRDRIHTLTTSLAKTHHVIAGQTLAVKNMMTAGSAGKKGLNPALADAGPGEMFRQLDYKTRWQPATLVKADRWLPSSKMCSGCDVVKTTLHPWQRVYHREHCGLKIHPDSNAAINLARYALKATAPSTAVVTRGADPKTEHSGTAGGCEAGTVSERSPRPKGPAA